MSPTHLLKGPVLVAGATGAQGGATVRALLGCGVPVRALTRDSDSPAARALANLGATLVAGDLDDAASLERALAGASGVFSVQVPARGKGDSERRHALALIAAARQAGVAQIVHTSVARAGDHTRFPRWDSGCWNQKYWTDKWDIEEAVRHGGFAHWTVLKPAFLMDNYAHPKVDYMFPHLREGRLLTALRPDTRLQHVAADDVGVFACEAFLDPGRFDGRDIGLAAEDLTMAQVAHTITRVLGKPVTAQCVTAQQAQDAGLNPGWVRSQEWSNCESYGVDTASLASWGLPLTTLADWVKRNAARIP